MLLFKASAFRMRKCEKGLFGAVCEAATCEHRNMTCARTQKAA